MTSWLTRVFFALFILAPAFAAEPPIVVGAVISQSGMLADLADGYRKGLLAWQDEVNAAGGVLGRSVELRLLDDGSEAARNSALYQQLIRDDKADALIGPYGTAATLMAAAEAEKTRHVMVNGAGSSVAVHRRLPRYVFQSAVPYAAFGAGVLQIAGEQGYRSLLILARDDMVSQEMAEAARESALNTAAAQGYAAGTVLGEALRRAGSADQEKLRAALAALELDTVLGRYKVDPKTGEQTGIKAAVVQIETGRPLAVWPPELRAAKPVLPYPQWRERQLLR